MGMPMKTVRTREQLRKAFVLSGRQDFYLWLREQPEADDGTPRIVTSASTRKRPPLGTITKNAVTAAGIAIASRFKQVSETEQKHRHSICTDTCEFYIESSDRCSKCWCWTSFKAYLAAWHCPIGKW
jgi:hypothetical protein